MMNSITTERDDMEHERSCNGSNSFSFIPFFVYRIEQRGVGTSRASV